MILLARFGPEAGPAARKDRGAAEGTNPEFVRIAGNNAGGPVGYTRQPMCLVSPGLTYCLHGIPFGWSRVVPFAERRPHTSALDQGPAGPHRPAGP
ncbi:hypothetical protein GCM10010182_08280 [Actinomadura cremea]|nr:hypothetical protein GCM10010182_08280 [Actinomadura cremea]